jgi:rhodanese-related sulfurtransferase
MLDLEVSVEELKSLLDTGTAAVLVDVREPWELAICGIPGARSIPTGEVPARASRELEPGARLLVLCHRGVRSLHVAHWLRGQGYRLAQSVQGGIDAWARLIDPSLPRY